MTTTARAVLWLVMSSLTVATAVASDAPDHAMDIDLPSPAWESAPAMLGGTLTAAGDVAVIGHDQLYVAASDGGALAVRPLSERIQAFRDTAALVAVPGGDRLLAVSGCRLVSLDEQGRVHWQADLGLDARECLVGTPRTVDDVIYVAWRNADQPELWLAALDLAGRERWRSQLGNALAAIPATPLLAVSPEGLAVASARLDAGRIVTAVVAVSLVGQIRWQWLSSAALQPDDLLQDPDGRTRAALIRDGGGLSVVTLDTAGNLAAHHDLPPQAGMRVQRARLDSGGGYAIGIHGTQGGGRLARFNRAGGWLWQNEAAHRCSQSLVVPVSTCAVTSPDDGLILLGGQPASVQRWQADGTLSFTWNAVDTDQPGLVRFALPLESGGAVIAALRYPGFPTHYLTQASLEWLDRAGNASTVTLLPGVPDLPGVPALFLEGDSDGGRLAHSAGGGVGARLHVIPADGIPPAPIELGTGLPTVGGLARCGEGGTCVYASGDRSALLRFEGATAVPTWTVEVDGVSRPGFLVGRDDGGVDLVQASVIGAPSVVAAQRLLRFDSHGTGLLDQTFLPSQESGRLLALGPAGHIASLDADGRLMRYQPDGSPLVAIGDLPYVFGRSAPDSLPGAMARNGSVSWIADLNWADPDIDSHAFVAVRVDATGGIVRTPLVTQPRATGSATSWARSWFLDDGDVLAAVAIPLAPGQLDGSLSLLLARIAADGRVAWQRTWTSPDESRYAVDVGAGGRILLSSWRGRGSLVLRALDGQGDVLDQREIACREASCRIDRADLAENGMVTVVSRYARSATDRGYRLERIDGMWAAMPPAVVYADLQGAWYNPAQGGQGFGLNFYPQGAHAHVFMPWFTWAPEAAHGDDALRWYTLQGQARSGVASIDLDIAVNLGGRFAAPPATQADVIGAATLRVRDCSHATLDYRFDRGELAGRAGAIALRRLLPSDARCPASGPQPGGAATVDHALTGNWYVPDVAGQGIDLQALGAGGSGHLFGAWYTFDPEPDADPTGQHWLTLQGARPHGDGSVTATLVQTLRGRFDGAATGQHFRVGEVRIRPRTCDRLDLEYRFDDSEVAGPFRALAGQLPLARLGSCPR